MENNRRCLVRGAPGVVKVNGTVWLCARCGLLATIGSLNLGIPVVMAHKGVAKAVVVPRLINKN